MKILVLSLLRIGDSFMHLKVIEGLKAKYPSAAIEIVINDEFQQHRSFFAVEQKISKVHIFPRIRFQKTISEVESHLLEPYWHLKEWIQEINLSHFDQIYNLTQTKLSGYLMGLLKGSSKFGLVISENQTRLIGTRWLSYFNNHFASGFKSQFHLIDVLSKSFDIPSQKEISEIRPSRTLLLQPLTSDKKKNWSLLAWKELKNQLQQQDPTLNIFVLAAPTDVPQLLSHFERSELLVVSFSEAVPWLQDCLLLISSDTSLVHLATLYRTPVLMLSLGSSDSVKTGPFLYGSEVISGKATCRPCYHDQACSQKTHLCGDSLTVNEVTNCTLKMIHKIHQGGKQRGQESRNSLATAARET